MKTEDYQTLYQAGADGLTIYQESYDQERYKKLHPAGKKNDYHYRYETPYRAALAGIRHISMGILLGLHDVPPDLWALYQHLLWMEKNFPGIEYSLSFPRLRAIKGKNVPGHPVDDITLIKIICLSRILFPHVGINLSTREPAMLRDHALEVGVTRLSAGSKTSVGGYAVIEPEMQNPQFDVEDNRTVEEIIRLLKGKNFDPVLTDWRRISNE